VGVKIFTPGHGEPTDALIANGIALSLMEECPDIRLDVLKQGSRYVIEILGEISAEEEKRVIENAKRSVVEDCEVGGSGKVALASRPQPAVRAKEVKKYIDKAFMQIESPRFITKFSDEFHIVSNGEGRGRERRSLFKMHLQVAPFAGSYLQIPYMTVGTTGRASFKARGADYVACPLCMIFSWAGLVKSASVIYYSAGGKMSSLLIAPSPIRATQDDIALLGLIFGERVESIGERRREISSLGGIVYSLATGETVGALSPGSSFDAIYWIYCSERKFLSIRDFGSVPLSNVYWFIAESKRRSSALVKLIDTIASEEPELLGMLAEGLIFQSYDAYSIARSLWSFLERYRQATGTRIPLDRGIVDTLIKIMSGKA